MRSYLFLMRPLFAGIFLLTLSSSAARGQAAPVAASWTVVAERGRVSRAAVAFSNNCRTGNHFRFTNDQDFIRFSPSVDAVFIGPTEARQFGLRVDAAKLAPGTYHTQTLVSCLDCRPPCNVTKRTIPLDVNVVEPAPRGRQEPPGDEAEAKAVEDALKKGLRRTAEAFRARERKLRPIKGVVPGTKQKVEGYDREEVLTLLAETKADLLSLLERKELRPFRDYVNAYFPAAVLKTVSVETAREGFALLSPRSFHAARAPLAARTLATAESTRAALENAAYFIASAESNGERFTLVVLSDPSEANVELRTVEGELVGSTSTNSEISGVWTGIYRIVVKKDGFLDIVHERQRLGDPDTVIDCRLVTSGTARLCQFR